MPVADLNVVMARQQEIRRWFPIVGLMPGSAAASVFTDDTDKVELLENMFARKATATLRGRRCSIGQFIWWASRTREASPTLPPSEDTLCKYMEDLRCSTAPATPRQRFLEAVRLCSGSLGMPIPDGCVSNRVAGPAERMANTKRVTVQVPPLPCPVLLKLENGVLEHADVHWRVLAGFVLFLAPARARCADAARVLTEPTLDAAPDGSGFLHATSTESKGARTAKKRRLGLPMVAVRRDLAEADAWI